MEQEIREIENTPEKAVYQAGEGKDALTFSITKGKTTYTADIYEEGNPWPKGYQKKETDYIELRLSSNEITFYSDKRKGMTDACGNHVAGDFWSSEPVNITEELANKLYDDNSKGAIAVKGFLKKIKGNELADELQQLVEEIPQRREKEEQERKRIQKEQQEIVKKLLKEERQKREDAESALNKFVGVEDEPAKDVEPEPAKDVEPDNKLARARRGLAKKLGLEDKPITPIPALNKRIKGLESTISNLIERKKGKSGK